MNESDICIYVVDGSQKLTAEDSSHIRSLEGRSAIIAINKSDLPNHVGDIESSCQVIHISAKNGEGIDALKSAIYNMAVKDCSVSSGLNVSAFQLEELRGALRDLREGRESAAFGDDVAAGLVGSARLRLLRVLGVDAGDELLDSMFSRFCVGK